LPFSKVLLVKGGFPAMTIQSFRADGLNHPNEKCSRFRAGTNAVASGGSPVDEVVDKYADMVYRLALSQVKTKHDAEDVFQDVFLRYIEKPRAFESEEHRKAWLIRVTINRSKSFWSSWFRKIEPLDESIACTAEEPHDLSMYLSGLPQKYRSVLHLFYYEEMTVKQIGGILNAKESTVRTWLTRARSILGKKLKGGFSCEEEGF
jgi:RNA polymerase sigma-70 factor (ECF subfamily)